MVPLRSMVESRRYNGRLLWDGDSHSAFGLVTGFLPASLRMALSLGGRDDDEAAVSGFVFWFRRHCQRGLWRPTFEAAKAARARSSALSASSSLLVSADETGYVSDGSLGASASRGSCSR